MPLACHPELVSGSDKLYHRERNIVATLSKTHIEAGDAETSSA
jgi:hypothetical protein